MKFKDFTINWLLGGVFVFALISFAIGMANNYGHPDDYITGDFIDVDAIQEEIESVNEQAESWEKTFTSDNIFIALGGIILFSIWGIIKLIWTAGFGLYNVLIGGVSTVLGIPPMVMGIVTAIFIIVLIFAAWRTIKAGE